MKRLAISVLSLVALLALAIGPAMALNGGCCNGQTCCHGSCCHPHQK